MNHLSKLFVVCCLCVASMSFAEKGGYKNKYKHYGSGVPSHHYGGGYYGGHKGRRCIAKLKRRNGNTIQRFRAHSCREARRQCMRAKFRPAQYCVVNRVDGGHGGGGYYPPGPGYPGGGYGNVSRVCYVDKINAYGGFAGSYSGVGYASYPGQAMAQACRKAMNQCQRFATYNQRCIRRN